MDEEPQQTPEPRAARDRACAGPGGAPPTSASGTGGTARSGGAGSSQGGTPRPEIRPPTAEDARDIVELVRRVPELDANSPYAYLLLCAHFGETGLVGREDGRLVAFVLGYQPPGRADTYFLWQVGVDPDCRGGGWRAAA